MYRITVLLKLEFVASQITSGYANSQYEQSGMYQLCLNKTQMPFVVVDINIGDISFFFLGLLLTLRYGHHLFVINGFNERFKGVLGFVSVESEKGP